MTTKAQSRSPQNPLSKNQTNQHEEGRRQWRTEKTVQEIDSVCFLKLILLEHTDTNQQTA
jgi:hypothetical protein